MAAARRAAYPGVRGNHVLPVSATAAGEIVKAANPATGDAIKKKVIAEFDARLSNLSNLSFFASRSHVRRWCQAGFAAVISKVIGFDRNSARGFENR